MNNIDNPLILNKTNSLISIAIPTFNQSEMLDFLFRQHISLFKKFNITVIVSDNASTDNTAMVVRKWQKKFPLIAYHCNSENIGYDKNVVAALSYSKTTYTWLIGDTYYISTSLMKKVLLELTKNDNADVFVINLENMVKNIASKTYDNQNKFLSDLGGIMTCLSCLIFHKRIINSGGFDTYLGSAFIHLGMILSHVNDKSFKAIWIADCSVESLKHPEINKRNWSHRPEVMDIGFRLWIKFIFSLPEHYTYESKRNCIRSFGKLSKLATFRGFFLMRMRGQLTNKSYKEYKFEINLISGVPRVIIRLISLFPKWPIKIACKIATKALNKKDLCL